MLSPTTSSGVHVCCSAAGLDVGGRRVNEILTVEWVSRGELRFRCLLSEHQPILQGASSFRKVCDLLVFTYPALLRCRDPFAVLQTHPPTETLWRVRCLARQTELTQDTGPGEQTLGVIRSTRDTERIARASCGVSRLTFDPHPSVDAILPLWGSRRRLEGKRLRHAVATGQRVQAAHDAAKRSSPALESPDSLIRALEKVSWARVHSLPYSSSSQRLCYFRIKSRRVSGYDRKNNCRGCPHCPDAGSNGGQTSHIFWCCPQARLLWAQLHGYWRELGLWDTGLLDADPGFIASVFGLRLPAVPRRAWTLPSLSQLATSDHRARAEVYPTLLLAWQQQVLMTFQVLLRWRQGLHEDEMAWSSSQASAIHGAALRGVLQQLQHGMAVREHGSHSGPALLRDLLAGRWASPPPAEPEADQPIQPARFILFFDGGSRGNPGSGGSGAVIVATDSCASTARVVWSASTSHEAANTTNNQAEYHGVVMGLAAAEQHTWTPLEVVGDSMLILRQLATYTPARNTKLLALYADARRSADRLGVTKWHHHLRAFNKMADHMANVAMVSKSSLHLCHPTERMETLSQYTKPSSTGTVSRCQ